MAIHRKAIFFKASLYKLLTHPYVPSSGLDRAETIVPILQKRKQGPEGECDLLRVTQQVSGRTETRTQVFQLLLLCHAAFNHVPLVLEEGTRAL